MELFLLKDGNPEASEPACGTYITFESYGSRLFGRLLLPDFFDRESRCPLVVMLHGHPGGDKNLDIGEALRLSGFAVAVFSYRGVWGSHGDYLLSHNIEDVASAVDFLRQNADRYRLDPDRVFLFGHSMGGFSALNAIARGLQVSGAVLMAPCDTGYKYLYDKVGFASLMDCKKTGYFRLASENAMEEDAAANAENWYFPNLVAKLDKTIPYCFIGGTNDTTTPPEQHIRPLVTAMQAEGFAVKVTLLEDGHMFPFHRATVARIAIEHFSGK